MIPSEKDVKRVMDNLYDALYLVDNNRKITYWNKAAEPITGFKSSEVIGKCCGDNILNHVDHEGKQLCYDSCPLSETINDGQPRTTEVFLSHKKGHRLPVLIKATPLRDKSDRIIGGIELFSDISKEYDLISQIEDLEKLALLDPLTQLPNRRHMESEIEGHLSQLERIGISFGLLFVDIDNFKAINDTHGHSAGDEVLATVGRTLDNCARPYDIIGRWGGEEFIGIFPHMGVDDLKTTAERLRLLVKNAGAQIDNKRISVTISIGGVTAKLDDSTDSLVKRADSLMYLSKKEGRDRVTIEP